MNHRRATARVPRSLAALLALALPLTAATLLTEPAAATAAETGTADASPGAVGAEKSASETDAFALARSSGKRVEIINRRTEYAETYANPDGTLTQKQFTLPIWTRHESVWRRTDATIAKREDGTIGPTASFGITFSAGGDGPLVSMDRNGNKLALSWPGKLPEPVVEGNTALYKSVLPGVDLKLIAEVDGFAEHLIVNTPEAAADPALKSIKLGVATEGVTLDDDATDQLLAKDADGNVVFSAPKPKMWEEPASTEAPTPTVKSAPAAKAFSGAVLADGTETATKDLQHAPVAADVTGNTLTLTPDPTLLAHADQFPLVIDPRFAGGYKEKWAVVYSATPDADYPNGSGWNSSNPADEPRVGYNGTGDTRSFFAMDTTGLHGSRILNATFAAEETYSWGCDASAAGPTQLWTSTDISTTPTWRNSNSYLGHFLAQKNFAHGHPNCPGVQGEDFKSAALTEFVQDGADGNWDPLVFALIVPDSYLGNVNSFKRFRNNPALEVDYDFTPTVDTAEAFEGSWASGAEGNKKVPCNGVIGHSGLVMNARVTDGDGGQVSGVFKVQDSATKKDVPFKTNYQPVASGKIASVTIRVGELHSGTFTWWAFAVDDEGTKSRETTPCTFKVDQEGPEEPVTVTKADGTAFTFQPARTALRLKLDHPATDLAGFCWSMDAPITLSTTPCAGNNWVPLASGAKQAVIDVTPVAFPESTLRVVAFDKAGNTSPNDGLADTTVLKTSPAEFVYPAGQTPLKKARQDLLGDLDGDGFTDMLAPAADSSLRFYAGDGTGRVDPYKTVGSGGWSGALIAHGGDFANFTSETLPPDGYEDAIVRLGNGQLYLYPGDGRGGLAYATRHESLPVPSDLGDKPWTRFQQIIAPGDIDQRTDTGHKNGSDMVAIECTDDKCTNARLRIYSGRTSDNDGSANQNEPFDVVDFGYTGSSSWKYYTILAIGDQNDDGVKDILARNKADGALYFYAGKIGTDGKYSLQPRTVYGTGGWEPTYRPQITTSGNAQGTVVSKTLNDDGKTINYKQFQPKAGDEQGDLWATTPADPNYTVNYVTSTGTPASTTCPTGCLLFYPGGPTTHKSPLLIGASGWSTSITAIY